ncbi:MAG: HAD-IG family 5'-nucleotidase [Myxococcota bacterium]
MDGGEAPRTSVQLPLPLPELSFPANESILPPPPRRIYCNRSLRLDRISWIGFDMDYTLAIYRQREMDRISIEATVHRLVARGYPEALREMQYALDFPIRGLLIDKKLGNVLKMDRYKYVKRAYHGMRELTREERRQHYHTRRLRPGSKRYHWVDTLYALSEVTIYAAAVQELEREGQSVDYHRLFDDVRECIDEAHRDGSVPNAIADDPDRFVVRDENLGPTFHKLRSAGKRLFLLTNSQPDYTERMMSYLLDGQLPDYPSWRHYFDLVVTASKKPHFFTGDAPFQRVTKEGLEPAKQLERGEVYAGGNLASLERQLAITGDQILYVGDHIFGDVLRAKKESGWRTAMIIQEMEEELEIFRGCTEVLQHSDMLMELRDAMHHELRGRQARLKVIQQVLDAPDGKADPRATELEVARLRHRRAIDKLRARIKAAEDDVAKLEEEIDGAFHPFWGSLFKAGAEVSSFGDQVEEYACIYTDRVSNLLRYSPMHYFRSPRDRMPHER